MNSIKSIWAFKLKRYPDRLIKKFKTHFCDRGNMQMEGIDFFKTYAPVVQWTTVRLMFILEVIFGLKSKQGDVTAAFLHDDLVKDEKVFVEMLQGFEIKVINGRTKVLKLFKLYMYYVKSPEPSGSTCRPRWNYVAWYNPRWIPVYSLERK